MYVGIGRYDFLVRSSTSLKDKRRVLRGVLGGISSRFKIAAAEVGHQDLRQRGAIGVSCVSESSFHARKVLSEVERFVRSQYELELVDVQTDVVNPDNA